MLKIGVLLGDDIGLEVVPEAVKVMKAAAGRLGLEIEWHELPIGRAGHERYGHDARLRRAARRRPTGGCAGRSATARIRATIRRWIMPPLRKRFELYASVKPVKSYANIQSIHKNVDIVFLREVTEGMQSSDTVVAGAGEFRPNDDITIAARVITRKGSNRVARAAEIARTRKRRKVTAVHKEPVSRLACGMFAEECRKVAKECSDVEFDEALVDGFSMKLMMDPWRYDVVVTTNQFGDILTDQGAGLVGGLGLAPGLCIGERQAMAQATRLGAGYRREKHCESLRADRVGRDAARMARSQLRRAARDKAARRVESAVDRVIAEGKSLTPDLGGSASTTQMGDAIAERV